MSHFPQKEYSDTFVEFEPWATGPQGGGHLYPPKSPHLLFLTVGLFMVLGPLSLAPLEHALLLKYARLGLLAFASLIAIKWYPRGGRLGNVFLFLAAVYAISSLWSDHPIIALAYKSMFFFMILGGLCLGNVVHSIREFIFLSRVIVSTAFLFSTTLIVMIQQGMVEPPYWLHNRFTILGLNANFVGLFTSVYFVFCIALTFFDNSVTARAFGLGGSLVFGLIVLYSGSRLSLLLCLSSLGLLLLIKTEKYRRVVIWGGVVTAIALMIGFVFSTEGKESTADEVYVADGESDDSLRVLTDLTKDTRTERWAGSIQKWQASPIIGVGWLHYKGRWGLCHSTYLQFLVEAGLLGVGAWCFALWCLFSRTRYVYINRGLLSFNENRIVEMGFCIIFCCLLYGVGESGLIAATMPLAIALGLGLQYIDEATAKIHERKFLLGDGRDFTDSLP